MWPFFQLSLLHRVAKATGAAKTAVDVHCAADGAAAAPCRCGGRSDNPSGPCLLWMLSACLLKGYAGTEPGPVLLDDPSLHLQARYIAYRRPRGGGNAPKHRGKPTPSPKHGPGSL